MIPEFLLNKLKETYPEDYEKITEGYNSNRINSLRINTIKSNKEEIISILKENNISYEPVTWYQDALIINADSYHVTLLYSMLFSFKIVVISS